LFVVRVSSGNARVPGDVAAIPPGHDAWVVGDEPVVVIDISGRIREAGCQKNHQEDP